jgi:hypothetical protein
MAPPRGGFECPSNLPHPLPKESMYAAARVDGGIEVHFTEHAMDCLILVIDLGKFNSV